MKHQNNLGFSLVEVVIAMGIAAVSLVTALGLLGVSLNSNASSSDDTVLVAMTENVLSNLRSVPFDTLWQATPGGKPPTTQPQTAPQPSHFYFSKEGDPVDPTDPRAHYDCEVRKSLDEATRSANGGPYNLIRLELAFSFPKSAVTSTRRPNQRSLYASLARY